MFARVKNFTIDREADAAYVVLSDAPVVRTREVSSDVIVDFDSASRPVGVEVLGIEARLEGGDARSYLQGLVDGLLSFAERPAAE